MERGYTTIIVFILTIVLGFLGGFIVAKNYIDESQYDKNPMLSQAYVEKPKNEIKIEEQAQKNTEKIENVNKKEKNNCPKPKKEYEDETYLNVNQNVSLTEKFYIPSDLSEIDKDISKTSLCIKEEALNALKVMVGAAKNENLNIIVSSGFRDYATQKSIMNVNIKDGNKNAKRLIAKPGYSEHQLGVAVDLTSPSIKLESATQKFGMTKESDWLEKHAYEYGFIESYPKGKEEITGYMYEPWHYRYVGVDNALEVIKSGKTLTEFLKDKIDNANKNKITH